MAKHYIRVDKENRIIYGFSNEFELPSSSDICINEDGDRHFELFGQVNPALVNNNKISIYKYINGEVVERTDEEIKLDFESIKKIQVDEYDKLKSRVKTLESVLMRLI